MKTYVTTGLLVVALPLVIGIAFGSGQTPLLLLGALVDPATVTAMLKDHLNELEGERQALEQVRTSLEGRDGPGDAFRYPALVADWGRSYFEHERVIIEDLLRRIDEDT